MQMTAHELWKKLDELVEESSREAQMRIEHREEILELVMQLFETDFAYAMEKSAHVTLWNSQKLLFGRVKAQQKSALAKAKTEQGEKRRRKYARNVLIAGVNCINVLRAMYCEWTKLVALVEREGVYRVLPVRAALEGGEEEEKEISEAGSPRKTFAKFVYLRLGDITRYMERHDASRAFYEKSLQLSSGCLNDEGTPPSPTFKHAKAQLERLIEKQSTADEKAVKDGE